MSRNDKFEVIASYGGGPIEVVKETHVERGYSSWYVRKRYSKDGQWHTTPYLRSINEMKAACHAFALAIAAEEAPTTMRLSDQAAHAARIMDWHKFDGGPIDSA